MWKLYKDKLLEILTNKHVPSKMTATKFTHPWINTDIKKLVRRKNNAHKKQGKPGRKGIGIDTNTSRNNHSGR
jgi:hypothetical protein